MKGGGGGGGGRAATRISLPAIFHVEVQQSTT